MKLVAWLKDLFYRPKNTAVELVDKPIEMTPVVAPVREKTEFEKLQAEFNPDTDMIVLGKHQKDSLAEHEKNWLDQQGTRVYCFAGNVLKNIAIIRDGGRGWY